MTETRRRRIDAARAIRAILALQLAIAAILFGRDIAATLPGLGLAAPAPSLTRPVHPGDQTRRFDPDALPRRQTAPGQDMPATPDMPSRLRFVALPGADGVVQVTGGIAPGDADRFEDWLATAPMPATIRLHSPGGSVDDALAIGRALRAGGVATEIAGGDICLSACPYILAGGTRRRVADTAHVGVHQHYFGENTVLPAFIAVEDIQRGQAAVMDHLDAMGIDLLLMRHSLATPADEIYILVPEELERYRLATEIVPG